MKTPEGSGNADRVAWARALLLTGAASLSCFACTEDFSDFGTLDSGIPGSVRSIAAGSEVAKSAWGAAGRVEMIAAIGEDTTRPEDLLLPIRSFALSEERIYLLGSERDSVVKSYDLRGGYQGAVGRRGQGPGEYAYPVKLTTGNSGDLYILDRGKVHHFDEAGKYLESRETRGSTIGAFEHPFVVTNAGHVYVAKRLLRRGINPDEEQWVMRRVDNWEGTLEERAIPEVPDVGLQTTVFALGPSTRLHVRAPYLPQRVWTFTPNGITVVGNSAESTIEIIDSMGNLGSITLYGLPTPVERGERHWYVSEMRAAVEDRQVLSGWNPKTSEFPSKKPFFTGIFSDSRQRLWVVRPGRGKRWANCNDEARTVSDFRDSPCWEETYSLDVFDADRRYIGSVAMPVGFRPRPLPVVSGSMILICYQDRDTSEFSARLYAIHPPGSS